MVSVTNVKHYYLVHSVEIKKMKEATLEDFKNIGIPENVTKNLHEQLHK